MFRPLVVLLLILIVLPSCARRLDYVPAINFEATQLNGKRLSKKILKKEITWCQAFAQKRMNDARLYGYGGAILDIVGSVGNVFIGAAMGNKLPDPNNTLTFAITGASIGYGVAEAYMNLQNIPAFDQPFLIDECLRQMGYILIQHK